MSVYWSTGERSTAEEKFTFGQLKEAVARTIDEGLFERDEERGQAT